MIWTTTSFPFRFGEYPKKITDVIFKIRHIVYCKAHLSIMNEFYFF